MAIVTGTTQSPLIVLDAIPDRLRQWALSLGATVSDTGRYVLDRGQRLDAAFEQAGLTVVDDAGEQAEVGDLELPLVIVCGQVVEVYPRLMSVADVGADLPGAIWDAQQGRFEILLPDDGMSAALRSVLERWSWWYRPATMPVPTPPAQQKTPQPSQPQEDSASAAAGAVSAVPAPFDTDGTVGALHGVSMSDLDAVDPTTVAGLAGMGIVSAFDLLHTVPRGYLDRSNPQPVDRSSVGEQVAFVGEVVSVKTPPRGSTGASIVKVRDTGSASKQQVSLTWFNAAWIAKKFRVGDRLLVSGVLGEWVSQSGYSVLQVRNPICDRIDGDGSDMTNAVIGVYPASGKHGVSTWSVRRAAKEAALRLPPTTDPVPRSMTLARGLPDRHTALVDLHLPATMAHAQAARRRLAYDELLRWQLAMAGSYRAAGEQAGIAHVAHGELRAAVLAKLPYDLTGAQQRSVADITADLAAPHPMNRLLQGEVGSGKAQPLDAGVLTPTGFMPMGEMRRGQEVITPCGDVARVVDVYPQGLRPVYRVVFSDDSTVRADEDHLWSVRTTASRHMGRAPKTLSTKELIGDLTLKNGGSKWYVDLAKPVDLDSGGARPIDPYIVGLLLGDGCLTQRTLGFSTPDAELIEAIAERVPGIRVRRKSQYDYYIAGDESARPKCPDFDPDDPTSLLAANQACRSGVAMAAQCGRSPIFIYARLRATGQWVSDPIGTYFNPLLASLDDLGLMGHGAAGKFVPEAYKIASVAVRHAVLQGLLDTDGTVNSKTGSNVSFSTISDQLALDVAWLVRSLGGRARVVRRVRKSGMSWYVSVALPPEFAPFRLARKAELVRERTKYAEPARAIRRIEFDGYEPTQCILIDHHTHLYVTDNFTPTHNTLTAALAMLHAVEAGSTAALMAPTEALAAQHHRDLAEMAEGVMVTDSEGTVRPVRVELLTNKITGRARKLVLAGLADGTVDIVVGTSSLLADQVEFHRLGLVVVDEQHRFGVEQRKALTDKATDGVIPDLLVMTATPVPRTALMTAFGDLDVSVLDELPPGRSPIVTHCVDPDQLASASSPVWASVTQALDAGRQVFVVTPSIADSEAKSAKGADAMAAEVSTLLPGRRIGVAHGKQTPAERSAVMDAMRDGTLDVLVATSVIEVGVNIPNSTVMVVTGAEHFGITQLHQLRGRVGRGQHPGTCWLVPSKPIGTLADSSQSRLQALVDSTDGFELARRDLAIRGAGSLTGTKQSGKAGDLKVADLLSDTDLIEWSRADAQGLIAADAQLRRHPTLRAEIEDAIGQEGIDWLGTR